MPSGTRESQKVLEREHSGYFWLEFSLSRRCKETS